MQNKKQQNTANDPSIRSADDTTNEQNISASTLLGVVQTLLLAAILILGLSGKFAISGEMESAQLKTIVAEAVKENAPKAAAPTAAAQPAPAAATQIDTKELDTFYKTAFVEGNKNADISIIEFSDVECPFCQRHTNNGTLDTVAKKYGDKVNIVYGHFPLSFHPYAQKAGEALECAGKLGGEDMFFSFKKALFAKGGKPTIDIIKTTATENKLDAAKMEECVNGGEFASKVQSQMAFGSKLTVTGTPGNIIINNKTGKFVKVSGAVPAASIEAAVDQIMKDA